MEENAQDVLTLLIKHELAIKNLYEAFAPLFTDHRDFWKRLASDEQRHADSLQKIQAAPDAARWFAAESHLKPQAVTLSISYVENQTAKALKKTFAILEALSIARDLENALLEKQFLKISDSAPLEIKITMLKLAEETEIHLRSVTETLRSAKR